MEDYWLEFEKQCSQIQKNSDCKLFYRLKCQMKFITTLFRKSFNI